MSLTGRSAPALIASATTLVGCGDGDDDARNRAIERNDAILRRLPEPPRARLVATDSQPYYREGSQAPDGYTTRRVYAAPRGTEPNRLIGFYMRHLATAWRCERERIAIRSLDDDGAAEDALVVLDCARGPAALSVDTGGMSSPRPRFELVVDGRRATRGQPR